MKSAKWYFDFVSPFAYLQNLRLDEFSSHLNVKTSAFKDAVFEKSCLSKSFIVLNVTDFLTFLVTEGAILQQTG